MSVTDVCDPRDTISDVGACNNSAVDVCDDIGLLLRSMPQALICSLPAEKIYTLLNNHFKPDSKFKFPNRYLDGCNRACQHKYFIDNPSFVYSKAEDGVFCLPCVLFADSTNLGQLVSEKFNHWTRKSMKNSSHNSTKYHLLALSRVDALKSAIEKPGSSIGSLIRQTSSAEIVKNRFIIKSLTEAVLFCGKQCIALRGHRDDCTADVQGNRGNFLALIDYAIRSGNTALGTHLKVAARNAIYTSKTTQNQLIECIGEYIRDKILQDIKAAKWFTILCDEVVDVAGKEQLSIVVRFVDNTDTIREDFVDFVTVDRITGEVLAAKLKEMLVTYDLDFRDCRGQGYDGAANMSGKLGVQGKLMAENPKAIIHRNSHI